MVQKRIRKRVTVLDALQAACARQEALILVTPYLRFHSNFLRLDSDAFHAAVTMSREEATFGLRSPDLKVRFPYRLHFLEAPVHLLGFGMIAGKPTLRLSIPEDLWEGEQRNGYRVDRVGRVPVTFSNRKYDLLSGTLVNISTGGARIRSLKEFEAGEVAMGDSIAITIPLTETIRFDTRARVRYVADKEVGVEFTPGLEEGTLTLLSRWVFLKREEDLVRQATRLSEEVVQSDGYESGGLVLVSTDVALEEKLAQLLEGLPALVRVPPTSQALKSAVSEASRLVFLHMPTIGLDERKRLKTFAELLGGKVPFMILGPEGDTTVLFEMGNDLKAAGVFTIGPKPSALFRRMVEGILRRHRTPEPGA